MTYHSTLYVMQTRFFMEAFMLVLASIRKSNVMYFINFKDNLQFTLKVMVQQFKVLCFIFSTAPRVFTKCVYTSFNLDSPVGNLIAFITWIAG